MAEDIIIGLLLVTVWACWIISVLFWNPRR